MQIDLIIRKQGDPGSYTISCDLAERLVFGRNIVSPVNLTGSEISREHFALFSRYGEICVQDLSSNGTNVNGKPVSQKKVQKVTEGDVISVPGYEIKVQKQSSKMSVHGDTRLASSLQLGETFFRLGDSLTAWEIVVIAASVGSFALIVYYLVG